MKEVYDRHFGISEGSDPDASGARIQWTRPTDLGDARLVGYTRDAENEIRSMFPILPNPILVMYVFPHLTQQGYPVPGYATSFPMYDHLEYALPGEVEGW